MEGVKSSPNNPGRQAILLSSLTLQPPLSHPLLFVPYISVTPIVSLLSLLYLSRRRNSPTPRGVPADRHGITAV